MGSAGSRGMLLLRGGYECGWKKEDATATTLKQQTLTAGVGAGASFFTDGKKMGNHSHFALLLDPLIGNGSLGHDYGFLTKRR